MTNETVPPADWSPPPIASGDLQWAVGTSSLDEFVLGHNPLDVVEAQFFLFDKAENRQGGHQLRY